MINRPVLSDLVTQSQTDIDGRLTGADSRLRRSVLLVLARVVAGLAHGLYGYIDAQFKNLFTRSMDEARLRLEAADYGLTPKAATAFRRVARATGTVGAVIEAEAVLQRSDGAEFKVVNEVTFASDTVDLTIEALVAGSAGITAAGSILSFVSPISGVSSQVTVRPDGASGGDDAESIEELRARLQERKRTPPSAGNDADWVRWAKEIGGVTRAWTYPHWTGANRVGVAFVFDGRADIIPTVGDVATMLSHLRTKAMVTVTPVPFAPTPVVRNYTMSVVPNTPAVKAAVEASLRDLLKREARPGGTILLTHEREAISLAAGETNYNLTSPAADYNAGPGEMAVFGGITWL